MTETPVNGIHPLLMTSQLVTENRMSYSHTPVLLEEVISLIPDSAKIMVDLTIGGGGHSKAMLASRPGAFLYGGDRDEEAILFSRNRLSDCSERVEFIQDSFHAVAKRLIRQEVKADFILADLGVSSFQIDNSKRGFSFQRNGPLDMRMNIREAVTAADILNTSSEKELMECIRAFGEERFAGRIAREIVRYRGIKPISTTEELVDRVKRAIPRKFQYGRIHPATKTFQAIRMKVNNELDELASLLCSIPLLLNSGGVVAVISFHSLEDRPVKNTFREWEEPCQCPKTLPKCVCGLKSIGKVLTRKVIRAKEREKQNNPRSRSARLRAFRKK